MNLEINIFYFLLATLCLISGHAMRVRRWNNLLPSSHADSGSAQFASLSIGYVANFFIPFRVGELLRSAVYSAWARKDFGTSLSSIIIERTIDVLVWVVLIRFGLVKLGFILDSGVESNMGLFLIMAGSIVFFASLLSWSPWVRKTINFITSIFNDEISFIFRHFFWTLGEVYIRLIKNLIVFLLNTFAMWGLYLLSYCFLSIALGINFNEIIGLFFEAPFSSTLIEIWKITDSPAVLLLFSSYVLSPLLFISLYFFTKKRLAFKPKSLVQWFSGPALFNSVGDRRDSFANHEQYRLFLLRSFRNEATLLSQFDAAGLNDKAILHRVFHGGSDALTSLVFKEGQLIVRKFASMRGKDKLIAQAQWLGKYKEKMPLAVVSFTEEADNFFVYDMPYLDNSRDFFEYIHTVSVENSWSMLEEVLNGIQNFHNAETYGFVSDDSVDCYIDVKLKENFKTIKELSNILFDSDSININGVSIDSSRIEAWLCSDKPKEILKYKTASVIHGDLTIENIIVNNNLEEGWFIIDPNVGNLFESPILDYAKLMQSLHFGYESLNRTITYQIDEGDIFVSLHRTSQYASLLEKYESWLVDNFGVDFLKEVRLHEIIHYMRLVPYKFRKDENIGIAFAACMLILVDEFLKEYGEC
jgi:hypothetical protein